MSLLKSTKLTPEAAVRLIQRRDSVLAGFAAGQPTGLLNALGERTDVEEIVLYTGLLLRPYTFLRNPSVTA